MPGLLQPSAVLVFLVVCAVAAAIKPPAKPSPYFSWDTVPIAFHGANKARLYNDSEVVQLAKYQMVTLEKWYTPCGSQAPQQAGPECAVEEKMATTFRAIKKINPKITTNLYLNSMFNFAFYTLNGVLLQREAEGKPSLLRDRDGTLVELCNDGNVYCNITNFDWSVPAVSDLWLETLLNMTQTGGVDGVFADHGYTTLQPPDDPQLCNGEGNLRRCYHFAPEFAPVFNAGHDNLLIHTQNLLANLTGGPVIDGPYADWHRDPCNFDQLREDVAAGQAGTGAFVIEANGAKGAGCNPDESCLAAFLCAAERYTYLACFNSQSSVYTPLPVFEPAFDKPLGEPSGPAVEGPAGVWTREFHNPVGTTTATYNNNEKSGTVQWAGDPPTPIPAESRFMA